MFDLTYFKKPGSEYGIHPFWFWNGEMTEEEIQHQIKEMADKGVTGFFLCARQGMTIPYLSDEWFEKVEFTIGVAARHNVEVWLYDEYPYPSGMAGGEVTLEHPDAKQQQLIHHVEKVEGGKNSRLELPWARVLSAKAVPVHLETEELCWEEAIDVKKYIGTLQVEPVYQKTGLTAYNQKRYFTYNPKKVLNWAAPEGRWEIHCFLEQEIEDFKYYGTFVDPLHTEAMESFIHYTHERYAETVGNHFGKTVKGIFTDETHLLGRFPWSPRLVPFIKNKYGYDIRDYLDILVNGTGDAAAKIRYQYFQSIHLLLRQVFHKQAHDWCEQNGLDYVAEVPSVRMAGQLYSHVPGGDSAHEKLGRSLEWILERYFYSFRANPKMVSSLSSQLGRDRALIECFHSVGWSMTLQDAKWMIDRMAAFGINFFNFHAFFYTLEGLAKHDAPPSQFLQNPYWEHFRLLGDYTARISYLMSEGTPVHPVAVLDPTTTFWTHMGNPFYAFSYIGSNSGEQKKLEKLKQHWADICISLTVSLKDYDHLDPELLSRAEIRDGKILIGHAAYSVLILPPISNLESESWQVIKRFIDQGGTVIANGLLPHEEIEEKSPVTAEMKEIFGFNHSSLTFWEEEKEAEETGRFFQGKKNAFFIPSKAAQLRKQKTEALFDILDKKLEETITVKTTGSNTLLKHHRKLSKSTEMVFLSNQENETQQVIFSIKKIAQPVKAALLNLETGEKESLPLQKTEVGAEVKLEFAAYQARCIIIGSDAEAAPEQEDKQLVHWNIDSSKQWKMTPQKKNMIRFDSFRLRLPPEEKPHSESVVAAKTFIDQCEDLAEKERLPIRFAQTFGTPMETGLAYPIDVDYQTFFAVEDTPSDCFLVMDRQAVSEGLDIYVNETKISREKFHQLFVYDHNNLAAPIDSTIRQGENKLEVKGKVYRDWEGLIDPLYLMGDFGVTFDKDLYPVITTIPETASSLTGPYPGLPYYAGAISFKRSITMDSMPETERFALSIPELEDVHESAELLINGHSLGVKAWSPYLWEGSVDILKEEGNVLEIKLSNTLIGLLEGKYFDYQTHTLKDVRTRM